MKLSIEKLVAMGFKRWQKNGMDRLYVNATILGLDMESNLFDGEKISGSLARTLKNAKTYIDLVKNEIHSDSCMLAAAVAKLLDIEYSYGEETIAIPEDDADPEQESESEDNQETETAARQQANADPDHGTDTGATLAQPTAPAPGIKGPEMIDGDWHSRQIETACALISTDGTHLVLTLLRRDKHATRQADLYQFELYNQTVPGDVPRHAFRVDRDFPYGVSSFDMADWVESSMHRLVIEYDEHHAPDHPPVDPCETCKYYFSTRSDGTDKKCHEPDGHCVDYYRYRALLKNEAQH